MFHYLLKHPDKTIFFGSQDPKPIWILDELVYVDSTTTQYTWWQLEKLGLLERIGSTFSSEEELELFVRLNYGDSAIIVKSQ